MDMAEAGSLRTQSLPEERSFVTKTWGSLKGAAVGSFTALMFGAAILVLSLLAVSNPTAVLPKEAVATQAGTIQQTEVKYYLPYPGILPDNPLYRIKMVRDRISLWFTFDPLKKAGKELLFADKRINAAVVLVEGGKMPLGVTTATKAEKYLGQSADRVIAIQKQGRDVKSWLLTLQTATAKHAQLLAMIAEKLEGQDRMTIERTLTSTLMVQENLKQALMDSK